jgi:hypothetical protein
MGDGTQASAASEPAKSAKVVKGPWPKTRPNWRRFDAEHQHFRTRFRPFLMDRHEDHLRRTPRAYRWQMCLLLNRVADDGFWRGRRVTLRGILGLGDRQLLACLKAMKQAGVITYGWRGDGTGWVRVAGFAGLLNELDGP